MALALTSFMGCDISGASDRFIKRRCRWSALLLLPVMAFSQGAIAPHGKTYGDAGVDEVNYVILAAGGGYLLAGNHFNIEQKRREMWIIRSDSLGAILWQKKIGQSTYTSGEAIVATADGGAVVLAVELGDTPEDYDTRLVKLGPQGEVEWSRTYGSYGWDWPNHLIETTDGGYLICGWTDSRHAGGGDLWLVKTDSLGDMQWEHRYGGPAYEEGNHILATADGGYLVTGTTVSYSVGGEDFWILKVNAEGEIMWMRVFGGAGDDDGQFAQPVPGGGFVVLGSTTSYGQGKSDIWLIRLTDEGNIVWSHTFGGAEREWGAALAIGKEGMVVIGTTLSSGAGQSDIWALKVSHAGEKLWSRTFGGSGLDFGEFIYPTADGGYILAGNTHSFGRGESDIWLIKINSNGSPMF